MGHLAVEIAAKRGARVLAKIGKLENAARLQAVGCEAIVRHEVDVVDAIRNLTETRAIDRMVDVDFAASQTVDARLIETIGTIVSYSSTSDAKQVLDDYGFAAKGVNVGFVQGFSLPDDARANGYHWLTTHEIHIPIAETVRPCRLCRRTWHVERICAFGHVVIDLKA